MLINYFKIAWRNLWKNKTFSFINILGLSIGIAAFLLIVNYLRFEYSFDNFHVKQDRIYRVPMEILEKGQQPQTFAFTYPAVAPALKKDFPEVEETLRMRTQGGVVMHGEQKIIEDGKVIYVDPAFFRIFSFAFEKGNEATALSGLNDVVITTGAAKKYFGNADPIGKVLRYKNEDFTVKSVVHLPANSHLQFNLLFNYNNYVRMVKAGGSDAEGSWRWSDFYTYVLLKEGTDVNALREKLPAFAERYMGTDMKKTGYTVSLHLQPLKDIHLRSPYNYELQGNGNFTYLKYLGIAALFILFIAWINYINLSTARSLDRSKEVGVRKVIGANKFQLIRQFLTESVLINVLAIILAVCIFKFTLPYFSTFIEKSLTDLKNGDWQFWAVISGLFVLGILLSGFYPAFVLSSFSPIQSLKPNGLPGLKGGKNVLRKSLVIVQFVAAIILIAGTIGFYKQLQFMSKRDLGINIQQTLVLQEVMGLDSSKIPNIQSFIHQLNGISGIKAVTTSTDVPGQEVGSSSGFSLDNSEVSKRCRISGIDNKFIDNFGLTLLAGRNFINDKQSQDTTAELSVIINETAAKAFGLAKPPDAINHKLQFGGLTCNIIGVVKDFHQESLQNSFDPIVFYPGQLIEMYNFSLKLNTPDVAKVIGQVKEKWKAQFPGSPFVFFFLDDRFNEQYKTDRLFSTALWLFTILAIIVASLGLFGLSLYTVAKRSKEISIRKVLGATIFQISSLITKDYLKLVIYAGLVAIPVAYYLLKNWLNDYAFHIDIGLWFFLLPLLLIVVIALVTVLSQSLRAALANPIKNLRSE